MKLPRTLTLYLKLVSISFRGQMQYRLSFLMLLLAYFIATFVEIFGIWVLFSRFQILKGWTIKEIALIYGVIHMGFSLAESTARGLDKFGEFVKRGDFDRLLLRPLSPLVQMAASEVQLMRLGRFLQGFLVLVWGCREIGFSFFSLSTLYLIFCVIATAMLFYGLIIVQATICFWTTETLEMMNVVTFGGVEAGQYPMSIYNVYFQRFFTFIVPLSCVAYFPISVLLEKQELWSWAGLLAPCAGIVFFYFSCRFWNFGVRHYQSTGS